MYKTVYMIIYHSLQNEISLIGILITVYRYDLDSESASCLQNLQVIQGIHASLCAEDMRNVRGSRSGLIKDTWTDTEGRIPLCLSQQ